MDLPGRSAWTPAMLGRRLAVTLALLGAARALAQLPLPGVDPARLQAAWGTAQADPAAGPLLGLLGLFAGGTWPGPNPVLLGLLPYGLAGAWVAARRARRRPSGMSGLEAGAAAHAFVGARARAGAVLALGIGGLVVAVLGAAHALAGPVAAAPLSLLALVGVLALGGLVYAALAAGIDQAGLGHGAGWIVAAGVLARLPGAVEDRWAVPGGGPGLAAALVLVTAATSGLVALLRASRPLEVVSPRTGIRDGQVRRWLESHILPVPVYDGSAAPLVLSLAGLIAFDAVAGALARLPVAPLATLGGAEQAAVAPGTGIYALAGSALAGLAGYSYARRAAAPRLQAAQLHARGLSLADRLPGASTQAWLDALGRRLALLAGAALALLALVPAALGAALGLALSPVAAVALLVVVRVTLATAATVRARVPALRTAAPPGPRRLGTLAGAGAPLQPALLAPAPEDESDLATARRRRLAARTAQSVAPRPPPVPAAAPPRQPAPRVPRYVDVRVLGQVQVDRAFEIMVLLTAAPPSGAEGAPIVLQVTEGTDGPTGVPPAAVRFEAPAFDVVIALDAALPVFAARDSGPARFVVQPRPAALGVQAMTVVVQQGGAVLYRSTGRGTVAPARVAGTLHWERGGGEAAAGRQVG